MSSEWNTHAGWDIDFDLPPTYATVSDYKDATSLVLAGGGMKGLYLLGSLEYLMNEYGMSHIESFYGTSVGALIAAMLVVGFRPLDILVLICTNNAQQLLGQFHKNIFEKKSLFNPEAFLTIVTKVIVKKLGKMPTLAELYEMTGKHLCVVTISRENIKKPLYVTHYNFPDIPLIKALHMSISIPFVFGYAEYDGKKYFDGGMLDNFPIQHAASIEKKVFGIDLINHDKPSEEFTKDLISIITLPISYITYLQKRHLSKNASYIEIKSGEGVLSVDFNKTSLLLYQMFVEGYRQCIELMKEKTE